MTPQQLAIEKSRDPYRADGQLALCKGCEHMIRWLTTEKGKSVPVAPFPLPGNWGGPLWGYGPERTDGEPPEESGVLYVLPASRRRAADSGWTGGARLHTRPPSTVLGYRPHWPDCPAAPASTRRRGRHCELRPCCVFATY